VHVGLPDTPDRPEALIGSVLAERYELLRVLGAGGMGAVYEATHRAMGKRLAVKVLAPHLSQDAKLVARFRREALAASRLDHENVVRVDDFGADVSGVFFIAMELVDGRGLGDELRATGPMLPERVARIGVQLLRALEAAHASRVLHRDLKPQNVMLAQKAGRPDVVKVVDFGIAKITVAEPGEAALTLPGTIFGTPEYMSPEQARGETLDARSDVYSASVVLWHLLLGRSPFRGTSVRSTLLKVFSEQAPSALTERPGLLMPPGFEDVLRTGLEKNRDRRWADAGTYAAALARFCDLPTDTVAVAPRPPRDEPPPTQVQHVPVAQRDTVPLPPSPLPAVAVVLSPPRSAEAPPIERASSRASSSTPQSPRVITIEAMKGMTTSSVAVPASAPTVEPPSRVPHSPPRRRRRISPAALVVIVGGTIILIAFVAIATLVIAGVIGAPPSSPSAAVSSSSSAAVSSSSSAAAPASSLPALVAAPVEGTLDDLPLDPLARDAALGRATRAIAEGRRADALVAYQQAVAADPTAPAALIGLGTVAMQQREWIVARDSFEKLVAIDRTYRTQFGPMYARAKRLAEEAGAR
jgi:serine/threonine protein kinase